MKNKNKIILILSAYIVLIGCIIILSQAVINKDKEIASLEFTVKNQQSDINILEEQLQSLKSETSTGKSEVMQFTITGYCPCKICCGEFADGITFTGVKAVEGRTIAVDPKVIPLGSLVYIEGLGTRVAEDIGGAIDNKHIDVFFNEHQVALNFGKVKRDVIVLRWGPKE